MQFRPFCSRRCADVDLGRWMSGDYAIASDELAALPEEHSYDDVAPAAPITIRSASGI